MFKLYKRYGWFPTQQAQERLGNYYTSLNQLELKQAILRSCLRRQFDPCI